MLHGKPGQTAREAEAHEGAECRMLRMSGADTRGMSTVSDFVVATRWNMRPGIEFGYQFCGAGPGSKKRQSRLGCSYGGRSPRILDKGWAAAIDFQDLIAQIT